MGRRVTCQGRHNTPGYCCYCKRYFGASRLFGVYIVQQEHSCCGNCLRHYVGYPLAHLLRRFLRPVDRGGQPEQLEGIK